MLIIYHFNVKFLWIKRLIIIQSTQQQTASVPFSFFFFFYQPSAASSTFHQAGPLIPHLAGGLFSMQPNVLIMFPAWSLRWWLVDYHLIKRPGQAGERRTCHSLRSSSEHRNNTSWRLASCLTTPEGELFLYWRKWAGRTFTVKYE